MVNFNVGQVIQYSQNYAWLLLFFIRETFPIPLEIISYVYFAHYLWKYFLRTSDTLECCWMFCKILTWNYIFKQVDQKCLLKNCSQILQKPQEKLRRLPFWRKPFFYRGCTLSPGISCSRHATMLKFTIKKLLDKTWRWCQVFYIPKCIFYWMQQK